MEWYQARGTLRWAARGEVPRWFEVSEDLGRWDGRNGEGLKKDNQLPWRLERDSRKELLPSKITWAVSEAFGGISMMKVLRPQLQPPWSDLSRLMVRVD